MKATPIKGPRPFKFERQPNGAERIRIGKTEYQFEAAERGYSIASGSEKLTYEYRKGKVSIRCQDGDDAILITYDFSKLPQIKVSIDEGGKRTSAVGDIPSVVREILGRPRSKRGRFALLRVFFFQTSLSGVFDHRVKTLLIRAIPYDDYYLYFRNIGWPGGGPGGGGPTYNGCAWWCRACALAILGTPGIPLDDIVACVLCLACTVGEPEVVSRF